MLQPQQLLLNPANPAAEPAAAAVAPVAAQPPAAPVVPVQPAAVQPDPLQAANQQLQIALTGITAAYNQAEARCRETTKALDEENRQNDHLLSAYTQCKTALDGINNAYFEAASREVSKAIKASIEVGRKTYARLQNLGSVTALKTTAKEAMQRRLKALQESETVRQAQHRLNQVTLEANVAAANVVAATPVNPLQRVYAELQLAVANISSAYNNAENRCSQALEQLTFYKEHNNTLRALIEKVQKETKRVAEQYTAAEKAAADRIKAKIKK